MQRTLPRTETLPYALYRAAQVRELDRIAIQDFGIPGIDLMERAGAAAFAQMRGLWPGARDVTVLAGRGNNGGDAYVVARLARTAGLEVRVLQLGNVDGIRGDAATSLQRYVEAGGDHQPFQRLPRRTDVIVDGLLGTGLDRPVEGGFAQAIEAANDHSAPVVALDIPSGLSADTGAVLGSAIRAEATVTFIALKQGLFTGEGPDRCGRVFFEGLEVPAGVYGWQLLSARRVDWLRFAQVVEPRRRTAHKGSFGHVLVVGGDVGYSGAARLAAEAAARTGAGLVSVATHPTHAAMLNAGRPELMCRGVADAGDLRPLVERATVVAVGPGLGRGPWGRALLDAALQAPRPMVLDADALNLLAERPARRDDWVLTPHPAEAARLLGITAAEVQADRFAAAAALQARFGGIAVLKGPGTVVQGPGTRPPAVCTQGNPGMASGGMGDVLTGVVAGLVAQRYALEDAAEVGVCVHGAAADEAASDGERGMLAGDLYGPLRRLLNPARR
jgi:NAD(P)H-hydrate epimerase